MSFKDSDSGELQLMAEYDFKNPVTATVIIYESDEELNTTTPVERSKRDRTKELDSIVSEIFEDIIRVADTTTYEKQINLEMNPSQNRLSSSPSDNIVCETFKHAVQVTNKTGQDTVVSVVNNVNKKNRRPSLATKQCDYEKSQQSGTALSVFFASNATHGQNDLVPSQITSRKRRRRLPSDSNPRNNSKKGTASNTIAVSVYETLNTTPTVYAQAGNNQTITRNEENSNVHSMFVVRQASNEVQPTERASSQSQNDFIADQCDRKLLETVKNHMVLIMKAHIDYVTTKRTSTGDVVEIAKKRFIETKTHLFYLSLSVVTSIILPRENDKVFVENIIQDAVRIAYSKYLFVKSIDMKFLFDEMCNWVKSHTFQSSIITELLKKGPEPINSNTSSSKSSNTLQYQSMPNNYAGQDLNHTNRMVAPLPTINTNLRINYCNGQHTMQPSNLMQANTTRPLLPPPYHQTWYGSTVHQPRHSEYQLANSTYDQRFVSEQGHVETNRSLSRDSGFQSPVDLLPPDTMSSSTRDDLMDSYVTPAPLITHVTSLNPSVLLIKDGMCHVCGALTRHKCLGCYKCYYCSHQCQAADWKNHVNICK